VGLGDDWRHTFWGTVIYLAMIPAGLAAGVTFDGGFQPAVRVIAAALGVVFVGLIIYAVLRVLQVLPVVRGARRMQPPHQG
jgi:hypothetical protein